MRLASDLSLVFAAVAAVEGMPGVVIGLGLGCVESGLASWPTE